MLLVTGGAGFIGSNVISYLNTQKEEEIFVVDDLAGSHKCRNLVGKKFICCKDWREIASMPVESLDISCLRGIVHLGAISDTAFSDVKILTEQNYSFSCKMLDLAIHHGCPMVYASSASVYGNGKAGFLEDSENERPMSPYAFSKLAFDRYVRGLISSGQLNVSVAGLRYFNVYGPGEGHKGEMRSFAHKCFSAILRDERINLFQGSQDIFRDFIYISDVVAITLFFLRNEIGGIFNIGTGQSASFLEVAELCVRIAGSSTDLCIVPFPEHMSESYQYHTRADITKLRAAGWTHPFLSLGEGIKEYWSGFEDVG